MILEQRTADAAEPLDMHGPQHVVDGDAPLFGDPAMTSNVGPDTLSSAHGFAAAATRGLAERLAQGFATDGSVGVG
jgi:hypothetical protein